MNILDLPDTVLMDILELLSYDEVAKKREVCTRFNYIGQQILNTGFNKITQEHTKNFKRIKSMLPRRESERRNHCLARHSDILTSIETRISMLTMTYSKFIDLHICCFIPGRVLDEISHILKLLSTSTKPLRPHEVLQELRDISSMAIEHFDEKIAVNYKVEVRNKLAESTGARLVRGSLADISFSGVDKRSAAGADADAAVAKNQPKESPSRCGNCQYNIKRHLTKQYQLQKNLTIKVNRLDGARKAVERRLQEALGTITELGTQVSELKRQLEDVVGSKRGALAMESSSAGGGGGSGSVKRPTVAADGLPPIKKPKV